MIVHYMYLLITIIIIDYYYYTLDAVKFMTIIKLLAFLLTDCDN